MKFDYQSKFIHKIRLLIPVLLLLGIGHTSVAKAQSQDLISKIDCESTFPECSLYLAPWRTGGGLTSDKLSVLIDGQAIPLNGLTQEEVGVQVAFALDEFVVPVGEPGYSIRTPGVSGQPKFVEFRTAAIDFFLHLEAEEQLDSAWLAAYRTGKPTGNSALITSFPPIADWVNAGQINVFYNELIDYEPDAAKNTPETPLYDLIAATLDSVKQSSAPTNLGKHVIVFTDGFERIETLGLDLLLLQAQENGIRIHTVMLGPGSQDLERTLQKLAQPTGGLFLRYESPEDMKRLWTQISSDVEHNVLSLTLPTVDAERLQLSFNGQTIERVLQLPSFSLPTVTINEPVNGASIKRTAPETITALGQIEPRELPITINLAYPDDTETAANSSLDRSERIEYVEYRLGDVSLRQQETPYDQIFFPIDLLDNGIYTLQVQVKDRYAGLSELAVHSIQIEVIRPEVAPGQEESTGQQTVTNDEQALAATEQSATEQSAQLETTTENAAAAGEAPAVQPQSAITQDDSTVQGQGQNDSGAKSLSNAGSEGNAQTESGSSIDNSQEPASNAPAQSISDTLRQLVGPFWETIGSRSQERGAQLLAYYRAQPRFLLIPGLVLALLLLFALQVRSVRLSRRNASAPQNFATSDPPNNDITEPEDATEPASEAFPIATLVFVRGEGEIPREILLHRQHLGALQPNQWSIGRSYQESDEVIESRRISRLHATITEQHGRFLIRDEGSSGGTYITSGRTRVRRRLEALEPVQLEDSDTINFNSIAYRFEVDRSEFHDAVTEADFGDQTEPELNIDSLL